ncbi:MAG: transglutaminase family protein [Acaryochloridaceae cyanobacterium RL_2_7]|nr:transglutaminase family protein [Acaryochloridaceae cyanobacterium RL_2_7]
MRLHINHRTIYEYEEPVVLLPHIIRLTPRQDSYQTVQNFSLDITPQPKFLSQAFDELGNIVYTCRWFEMKVRELAIHAESIVETHCTNPYHYYLDPWAISLPMDNPHFQIHSLRPYLEPLMPLCSTVVELAEDLAEASQYQVVKFLSQLNRTINESCTYIQRLEGPARPAGLTWRNREGSCRDFAQLFVGVCQSVGLAARFVSGYERGAPEEEQTLHAWAEVYLPGAGWRGYDPTLGIATCDRHVSVTAHWLPALTLPIGGSHQGKTKSQMKSQVLIETD